MKAVFYKDFKLIKENINFGVLIIVLLLWYTQFLILWYLCWKFFLYFIIFKSFFFFFFSPISHKRYLIGANLKLLKTLDYASTKAALNITNSLKKLKMEGGEAFIFLLVAFFKVLIVFFFGYSLKFIYLTSLLANKQLMSFNYLKFKSPFTFIRGTVFFFKKNLIAILEDEYIYGT